MKILIVEKNEIVQRGMSTVIQGGWSDTTLTYRADWCGNQPLSLGAFDLIVMEPVTNEQTNIQQVKDMMLNYPQARLLIYSHLSEEVYAVPFLKAGVKGFLNKQASEAEVVTAISCVSSGGRYASDRVKDRLFNRMTLHPSEKIVRLSSRELEVASLLVKGLLPRDIAQVMNISVGAASTYKVRIFKKFSIRNIIQLAELMKTI